ncbi:hypothetical protein UFOVP450_205 [uncultured Caudovirales phage]|uniref:Baseplate hub assembly protein, bacteriophage T4-like n=1 Tax=uncultured Caudovirales phage TaxID=2100421 RepID=A0A6J5MF18_9CAUD|nr:hypothetical protein UFOVP450_205 [uncultured Caudovirales phage]
MSNTVVNDSLPGKRPIVSDEDLKAQFTQDFVTNIESKYDGPTEIIDLPSRGYFYPEGHPLAEGKIEIKYMTAKEEDILSSATLIKQGVVIDRLLQALIITKVKYDDILLVDKNAIFIAARVLAYGNDYPAEITCPSCESKQTDHIDLSTFEEKPLDWSQFTKGKSTFEFTLPVTKKVLTLRLLTHGDDKQITENLKAAKKMSKLTGVDPELTTRLRQMIVAIDGNEDKAEIHKLSQNMLSRDSLALREYLKSITPDIETVFHYECGNCGHEVPKMAMPITVQFFWPGV